MTRSRLLAAFVPAVLLLAASSAGASTIAIDASAFGAGTNLTTFDGQADGSEANGAIVDGILFQYSLGNGQLIFDGGPGTTNNISPINLVSGLAPANAGTLTLTLPSYATMFGYGYAVLTSGQFATLPAATTISLFNGATLVGSGSYDGAPDPTFIGGFAGIQSTVPFDRVQLTFDTSNSVAFALDNIRTNSVPEPSLLLLFATGVGAIYRRRRA